VSKFRPPRRSGWRAPWISGVLAVLIAAALAGAGAVAGAQEADPNADQSAVAEQGADQNEDQGAGAQGGATTTTEGDDGGGDDGAVGGATTTTAAGDGAGGDGDGDGDADGDGAAGEDTTTTTAAGGGQGAAIDNSNFKDLDPNSGVQTGTVFNDTPYGEIPGNTPQVLIQRPGSGRIIPLNRELTVRARFDNFVPGFFSNPQAEYGLGTQRLDENGNVQGHNHACFQRISRRGTVPEETCNSFVVMAQEGDSDILVGTAPPLTEPGRYRLCVDAAAGNHYPATRAFAQRGGPVDCVRVLAMDFNQLNGANQ
jgi:hypothetical protein